MGPREAWVHPLSGRRLRMTMYALCVMNLDTINMRSSRSGIIHVKKGS
jgi:hypothetical protein